MLTSERSGTADQIYKQQIKGQCERCRAAAAAVLFNCCSYTAHTSGCCRPPSAKIGEPTRHHLHPERTVVQDERQLMLAASKLALSDIFFRLRASRTLSFQQTDTQLFIVSFVQIIADKSETLPTALRVTVVRCMKLGQ